jgi:predicted metal-dependent phosphoesterase TrpH
VGNPDLISRTHFARWLVETGVCDDTHSVFRRYLTEGNPGYVPHSWARLGDAVRWIRDAGGMAIIAHPARYRFTPRPSTRCSPSSWPTAARAWKW